MKYFHADFLTMDDEIAVRSVDLFISSLPVRLLSAEGLDKLFDALDYVMTRDGYVLLDMPMGYGRHLVNLYDATHDRMWHTFGHYIVEDMYPGLNQIIYVFERRANRKKRSLIKVSGVNRRRTMAHPVEFCDALISTLIDHYSEADDVVLDGFCGTGTVPGEAERLGRFGIGVDVRPFSNLRSEYCENLCDRERRSRESSNELFRLCWCLP